ncbi:MAG: hypothetical protein COA47_00855 [Robiginitomaculum sp.]|nr:MAG: hypothetical protein COA47_00855 [Robiginitomaculum sp.]
MSLKLDRKANKRRAERFGRWGEALAVYWLLLKGYQIRERRFRCAVGEIDLIATRGKTIVFIEVKYRRTGATSEDVSPFQADRIVRSASLYLAQNTPKRLDWETRFDLILLGPWRWPSHLKAAFGDDGWGNRSIT